MLALELTDVKDFMNKFLRSEVFDHFLVQEGIIHAAASYVIDGKLNDDFYTETERQEQGLSNDRFLPYSMLRANFFDLIKGKKAPSSFKVVLMLSHENLIHTLASIGSNYTENDITAICLNIHYQNQQLTLTTGISYRIFSIDKSLEHEWDRLVLHFLRQNEIPFQEVE